jgi:hypothetical protein
MGGLQIFPSVTSVLNTCFLGTLAKFWKAAISFVMSVCLSVCLPSVQMKFLNSHWLDFRETLYEDFLSM